MANSKYAQVMAQEIFRRAAPGTIFLVSDLDFDQIRETMCKIEKAITDDKLGKVILPVQEQPAELVSNFDIPQILCEYLFTAEDGKLLCQRKRARFISRFSNGSNEFDLSNPGTW